MRACGVGGCSRGGGNAAAVYRTHRAGSTKGGVLKAYGAREQEHGVLSVDLAHIAHELVEGSAVQAPGDWLGVVLGVCAGRGLAL